jgi:ribonuclease BN (tRNA processing enzyme)
VAQLDAVLFTHLHIDHSAVLIRLGGIQPDRRCVSSNLVGRQPAVLTLLGASQKVPLAVKLFCARHSSRRLKAARDRRTFATAWPFKQGRVSPA